MPKAEVAPAGTVAAVTVSYRSGEHLDAFLASVDASDLRPQQVIVVDNAADDRAAPRTSERHGARYLPMASNPGYGGGMNAAVATLPLEIEWVLLSNPDVVLEPSALGRLVEAGVADPQAGSVGPLVRNADGTVYPSARAVPSLRVGAGHAVFARIWPGNPWTRAYHQSDTRPDQARQAGWLSGSCLLVRRSAFDSIDGFDEHFFMYFEDVDLGYRLGRSGFHNLYEPKAVVTHTGAHSTASSAEMIRAHHRSAERFVSKKYAGPVLAPIRWALVLGLRLRARVVTRGSRA